MRKFQLIAFVLITLLALFAAESAAAHGGGHFHGGAHFQSGGAHHFHHHHHGHFGVFLAAPLFVPWGYESSLYYREPASPPVYIERADPGRTAGAESYWYHCADPEGYYPYVQNCAGGWQRETPRAGRREVSAMRGRKPLLAVLFALAGCSSMPTAPSVMVLPGSTRSFESFRADDALCRDYALEQVGGKTPGSAASESVARSAGLGTALGAAAGAAVDGRHGAATGAGVGLAFGGLAGTGAGETSASGAQRHYDIAYEQCMYAQGHRVPVRGRFSDESRSCKCPPLPPAPPGYRSDDRREPDSGRGAGADRR